MKIITFIIISIFTSLGWHFTLIKHTNDLKEKAATYCKKNNLPKALAAYYSLSHEYHLKDENIDLNMANCYFELGNIEAGKKIYTQLSKSENKMIKAQAYTQLGVCNALMGKKMMALSCFKLALIADPSHDIARYNYELLTKKNPDKANTNKVKASVSQKSDSDTEAEIDSKNNNEEKEANQKPIEQEALANNNFDTNGDHTADKWNTKSNKINEASLAKAMLLLEYMKQQEINYLQQKKINRQKKKSQNSMDW